ncbi:MAG: condensation domain-containing protein, partial [Phocaeicola sp.]
MSFSVFSDELSRAYNGETIDPEPINGFEIAKREIDARQSKQYEEAAAWYEKEFGDAAGIDSKPLPDVNEEKEEHFTIEHHFLNIDKEEIKAFCERTGTKESSLFSAVFGYTLSRFTGDSKVLYATVYHGRTEKLTRRSFCMMVKTLPVYHDFTKTPTVIGLLQQTRDQMTGNRSHLSFSYGDLHDKLGVNCDVSFAYHGAITASDITINGRIQKKKNLVSHTPGFKLLVQVITSDKGYEISFDYDTNLYSEEFIHTLCNCYNKVLKEMLTKENLCDISLCDELQLKKLEAFNRTECDYDNTQTIPSLFRKAAAMYPDNECVVYDGRIYTYKEVD